MSEALEGVILSGGLGSRLRSAIGDRQKTVADVGGRPFICRILEQIAKAGVRKAVLCVGYKAEEVETALGSSCCGIDLSYSVENSPLGTGGAVRLALSKTEGERLLVMNGDSFIDADLGAFFAFASGKPAAILLRRVEDCSRYGKVAMDASSRVVSFQEKAPLSGPGLINAGIYILPAKLLSERLAEGRPASLEQDFLPGLCDDGLLYGMESDGAFIDIGTPDSYNEARRAMAKVDR